MRRRRVTANERIIVVGGGRAGAAAAEELRRCGYDGHIVVLSADELPPYHRPSCSTGLLTGRQRPQDVALSLDGCVDVDWRFGRRVAHLDVPGRAVLTECGEVWEYDGLIVATGTSGSAPRGWPVDEPGIHRLHSIHDAWALRRELRDAQRVAVVGGGLTGCEVASAVGMMARDCTIIESKPRLMTKAVGHVVSEMVTEEIRRDHVDLRLGRRVRELVRGRRRWQLLLDNGDEVDADLVVTTTGERPDTTWLAGSRGIDTTDGVLCDETLRVVGADGIVAAGASARWPNLRSRPRTGGGYWTPQVEAKRSGQWITAIETGRAAARTLLAGDRPSEPVTPLVRYWTEQFGMKIQVSGELDPNAEIHLTELRPGRRGTVRGGVLASYVVDGDLVGLVGVNASQAFNAVTRSMMATGQPLALPSGRHGYPDLHAVS